MKFNKYNITSGTAKVRVHYVADNRIDGRKCVTLYAKDYGHGLGELFYDDYKNETDTSTDYFETGRVVLFETHQHYSAARMRAAA